MQGALHAVEELASETYGAWRDDRTLRLGAGLAYYGLFTLIPFFLITAAIAEPLFGSSQTEAFLADKFDIMGAEQPDEVAAALTDQFAGASTRASLGLVGLGTLLFTSSLLFLALSDAIKTIWNVPFEAGWRQTVRRRLISFAMVLAASVALVAQFAVAAVAGAAQAVVPGDIAVLDDLARIVTNGVGWAGLAALVTLLFRLLAPVQMPWRTAGVAGTTCAVLLVVGTVVVGWYLRRFGGASVSGAFGAVAAVLTWVYFEAQILLAGVQFSKVLTSRGTFARPIHPAPDSGARTTMRR